MAPGIGIKGESDDWDFVVALVFAWMPLLNLGDHDSIAHYIVHELPA